MPDSNLTPLPWQHIYDELNVVVPPIEDRPLGSYVEEFSVSLANSPALQYFDRTITYAELNAEANQMANALGVARRKQRRCCRHAPNQYSPVRCCASRSLKNWLCWLWGLTTDVTQRTCLSGSRRRH